MKTKKKALLLTLCAVLLVAASVLGTMAYLTSNTGDVVNTFTVGNVKITLDEADVDLYGEIDSDDRVLTNNYKLIPGHTYIKDPTVHVDKGSEDCYVRMFVTVENYQTLLNKLGTNALPETFTTTWNSEYWTCANYAMEGNNAVLEFRHNAIVTIEDKTKDFDLPALFEDITLPGDITDLEGLENVKIIVSAEAIQADGFADAAAAFTALNGVATTTTITAA